jgi:EmrB/QacA subfamily drug resistance transporter
MPSMPSPSNVLRVVPLIVAGPLLLQNLDSSAMTTALPSIAASLGVRTLDVNLAITANLLSLAVFLPVSGWLAERLGPKRVFCGAILAFAAASILCAAAQSLAQLVALRIVQGIGGALMVPVGRLILLRTVPPSQMINAMVWFTIPGAIGRLIGPVVGGAVVTYVSWRYIFLVGVPFALVGAFAALRVIDRDPPVPHTPSEAFDATGFVLLAVGLVGMLGGVELYRLPLISHTWTIAMMVVAAIALLAYVRHSRRLDQPLVDLSILELVTYRANIVGGLPLRIAIGAVPFLLPLLMQLGLGLSPMESGLLTVAVAIGSLGTRTVIAWLMRSIGFRTLLMVSALVTSAIYMTYSAFGPGTPRALMFAIMLLGGLFNSTAMVALNTLGYTEVAPSRASHATTMAAMAQQLSSAIGVVLGTALLAVTHQFHGEASTPLQSRDFAPAFLFIGGMTLISVLAFRKLSADDGEELRKG